VLWRLVSTSSAVSALPAEGQFLSEVSGVMRQTPWNSDLKLPWKDIKKVWDGYWDQDKPLLLEKSPPNLIRVDEIVAHFHPVHFLIMVRNPYAHCHSLMRRNNSSPRKAAEFTVRCMKQQWKNAEKLDNKLCFTYEQLATNPESISLEIQSFIPQLGELDHMQKFNVHSIGGVVEKGIVDLNKKKIQNLSVDDFEQINQILRRNADVMAYWNYEFLDHSRAQQDRIEISD